MKSGGETLEYALSNGDISSDLEWFLTITNHRIFPYFVSPFIFSYWVEIETSNLVGRLFVASSSPWMTNYFWKGRGQITWPELAHLIFLRPNISLERLKSQLSSLQQIQNSLARTVVKAPKSCHITPILRSLHWLRITERIEYKLLSLTYKVLTTTQPPYLHNLISIQCPRSIYLLFIRRYSCSATFIILSKSNWLLLPLRFTLSLESAPFASS